jgi:hypothetical protein
MSEYPQQPPPGYGYAPDHPRATVILVLGILSLVICQILGPVAWVMGNSAIKEIDSSGGALGGRGTTNAGRICGIVATVLLLLGVLFGVILLIIAIAAGTSSSG